MADPEDSMQPDGAAPDGRPRRPPPIIEGEAVELTLDGSRVSSAGPRWSGVGRLLTWILAAILASLSPRKLAAIVSAGVIAVIVAGALWIYRAADGGGTPPQNPAGFGTASSAGIAGPGTRAEAVPQASRLPSSPDRSPETGELEKRMAAVDATLASLAERVATLDRMVRESIAVARAAMERADRAVRLLDEARRSGDEQEAAQQLDRGALDDLASRIKTLESRQMTLRQVQERLDRLAGAPAPDKAARAAVVTAALRNAVERDRPFVAELAAARTTGVDEGALASLEPFATTGLPKRADLFRELSALLPELRRMSALPGQDLGYLDRLQASAVKMLKIRPVKDEPGDDLPAILGRIEFRMAREDIDATVTELDKLPSQAKELAQPWRTKALARRDAVEAARLMATASLVKLGEPATSGSSPQ